MLTPTGVTAADYWDAIKSGNKQHLRMTFPGNIVLDESDIKVGGVHIYDVMNGDIDLTFGKSVMRELNVQLVYSSKLENISWNSEFTLEIGVEIEGETEWVTVGLFRGDRPDKVHYVDVINFTAYDRMQLFDIPSDRFLDDLNYPITFSDILSALCTYVGVEYTAGNELENIKTRSFDRGFIDPDVITCRDLLSVMAEACGCYAKITATGKLKMVWFNNASYGLERTEEFSVDAFDVGKGKTWEEMRSYTWEQARQFTWADLGGYHTIFRISQLNVKLTEDDIGVSYGNSAGNTYLIIDNPFLTINSDTDADTYIKPIYERLYGFGGYLPASVNCIGNWLIETGDVIDVDVHGDTVALPVFNIEIVWNGMCISTYQATGRMKRRTITESAHEKLASGGKYHLFKVDIDTLFSEIADAEGNIARIEQIATELSLYVENNVYKIQSGIDINAEGITITGAKSISINSGGIFKVDSPNFKIDSSIGYMESGKWKFDDSGVNYYDSEDGNPFQLKKFTERTSYSTGIYYNLTTSTQVPQLFFVAGGQKNGVNHEQIFRFVSYAANGDIPAYGLLFPYSSSKVHIGGQGGAVFESVGTKEIYGAYTSGDSPFGDTLKIYPCSWSIGSTDYQYQGCLEINRKNDGTSGARVITLRPGGQNYTMQVNANLTGNVTGNIYGTDGGVYVSPRGSTGKYIKFEEYTLNSVTYTKIWGNGSMIFEGDLTGNVTGQVNNKTTTATNFNNITDTGTYWITVTSQYTNVPQTTIGQCIVVVNQLNSNTIAQMIWSYTTMRLYIRTRVNGTWGYWYTNQMNKIA